MSEFRRQVFVQSQHTADAWEIGKTGIGGQRQNEEDGSDGYVIEDVSTHDSAGDL